MHWISDRIFTPDEWQPYADGLKAAMIAFGLKADASLTSDRARVLRLPGTINYKIPGHPRPTKLLHMEDYDYDFSARLSQLLGLASTPTAHVKSSTRLAIPENPAPAFMGRPVESLADGITDPLDNLAIFKGCPHMLDALQKGGKDFSQGLWNLTTLAATFMENGHDLAHKLARGHPEYSYDETDALWHRKMAERNSRKLGWPACKSFQAEGCKHCATCPVLARGQSPLHLGRILHATRATSYVPMAVGRVPGHVAHTGPYTVASGAVAAGMCIPLTDLDMPTNFVIRKHGPRNTVHKLVQVKARGGGFNTEDHRVFNSEFYLPWARSCPDELHFVQSTEKSDYRDVTVLRTQMTVLDLEKVLLRDGVSMHPPHQQYVKEFIVSWLDKLNAAAASVKGTVPFGWIMQGDICEGFSYGSVLYRSDGTIGPAGNMDLEIKRMYGPCGTVDPWKEAFQTILDQHRPGLEVIVAAAFGSPLMKGTGEYQTMFSAWGETGGFKSTAMIVGLAVWGHPQLTKENEGASEKSVMYTLGTIRNLPFMWDEIKEEKDQAKVHSLLYRSGGKDNSRLTVNIERRAVGTWQNIVGIAANKSFVDYVATRNSNTEAGIVRVFEWREEPPVKGAAGLQESSSGVSRIMRKLDTNFGEMGKLWSAFLGENYALCMKRVDDNCRWFEKAAADAKKSTQAERFWIAFCAATLSGAELANDHLGLSFDTDAMRRFLLEKLFEQRTAKDAENIEGGTREWTEERLSWFLNAHPRETLRTEDVPTTGAPNPQQPTVYPEKGYNVKIHWVTKRGELRISQKAFDEWLALPTINANRRMMKAALTKHFGMRVATKMRLGAGTTWVIAPQAAYVIPVQPNTPLWDTMTWKRRRQCPRDSAKLRLP